jgi:hypothetical protein
MIGFLMVSFGFMQVCFCFLRISPCGEFGGKQGVSVRPSASIPGNTTFADRWTIWNSSDLLP